MYAQGKKIQYILEFGSTDDFRAHWRPSYLPTNKEKLFQLNCVPEHSWKRSVAT